MSVRSRDSEEISTVQVVGAHRPEGDRLRPSTAGYWLAVVIAVGGLVGGARVAIGTFEGDSPGRYEVRIDGTAPPGAEVAIGETIANSRLGSVVGAALLILGSLGVGVVLTIVTAVRRSAH